MSVCLCVCVCWLMCASVWVCVCVYVGGCMIVRSGYQRWLTREVFGSGRWLALALAQMFARAKPLPQYYARRRPIVLTRAFVGRWTRTRVVYAKTA